jgi:hypothetical protein
MRTFHDQLSAERDRAIADKRGMPRELFGLWKEGNILETNRERRQKAIDAMPHGELRRAAQAKLNKDLNSWNARARRALLTTP